jgi:hypothetical protein
MYKIAMPSFLELMGRIFVRDFFGSIAEDVFCNGTENPFSLFCCLRKKPALIGIKCGRRQDRQKETTMPTDIRIIHAHDFIKATLDGQLDLERAKEALLEIASASSALAEYEIILDTRKAESGMSIFDLWYLALELEKFRKTFFRKTAVLCPLEGFDSAEFFALCAKNRNLQIRAFTSFEEAIEWLVANQT